MSKLPLTLATAALGLTFVASTTNTVTAEMAGPPPSDNVYCYYNMYHCSYDGDNYWSGCDSRFHEGYIATSVARSVCTKYHPS